MNIINTKDWGYHIPAGKLLIAGPCSAETEEQLIKTALQLSELPVFMLRAGIWKPRTRPNAFEGVGEKGLPWLNLASKTTGLPVCVEVASPEHVELALKYEVVLSTKSVFEILSLSIDFFSFLFYFFHR